MENKKNGVSLTVSVLSNALQEKADYLDDVDQYIQDVNSALYDVELEARKLPTGVKL